MPRRRATAWAVAMLVALAVIAGGTWLLQRPVPIASRSAATASPAPATAPATAAAGAAPAPSYAAEAARPRFDIVRVAPSGDAVIAGRAAPGAEVVVRSGTQEIGRTTADAHGDFVLTPAAPLPAGPQQLSLTATPPGGTRLAGDAPVVLVVPDRHAAAPQPALALLTPPNAAPRLLQGPDAGRAGRTLGLGVVDYDEQGRLRFAGTAPPGTTARVYVDNRPAGDAAAGADGRWTLTPEQPVAPGNHRVRIDQLGPDGRVTARIELPFQRADLPPTGLAEGHVVVQPGENLWRLARHAYGAGIRYTVIYAANRDQIRDPKLIYPGQAFAMPTAR